MWVEEEGFLFHKGCALYVDGVPKTIQARPYPGFPRHSTAMATVECYATLQVCMLTASNVLTVLSPKCPSRDPKNFLLSPLSAIAISST